MLQCLAPDVFVEVRQDVVGQQPAKKRVAALQYVLQNRSLQRVTVRLDFSLSRHIKLVFPEESEAELGDNTSKSVFEVTVDPLQRRHVVHVVRVDGERAYVRVEYAIVQAVGVDRQQEAEKEKESEELLQQFIAQSAAAYRSVAVPSSTPYNLTSGMTSIELRRWCADINRWSRQRHVLFVDPVFSPSWASLWGRSGASKPTTLWPVTWRHLSTVVDASWRFLEPNKVHQERVKEVTTWNGVGSSSVLDQDSWVCAMSALHDEASEWCTQWFDDRTLKGLSGNLGRLAESLSVVGVSLCPSGRERVVVVVDLFAPVIATTGEAHGGLVCAWPHSGETYAILLQKAYAKLCGSYMTIATVPTRRILLELTGRPIVQVFRNGTWDAAYMKARLRVGLKNHKRRSKQSLLVVSFAAFDDHHCAFQLLSSVKPSSSSQPFGFRLRDPTANLHHIMSAKLQLQLEVDEEDGTCLVPEEAFAKMSPVVFEVLVDHSFTRRRRRVHAQLQDNAQPILFQLAISCASLQHLVVRCDATCLSGATCHGALTLTVDQVGDDETWTQLDLQAYEADKDTASPSCQINWIAPPGENVISFSMTISRHSHGDGVDSVLLLEKTVHENLSLLFRILDQDMDDNISTTELVDFLCDHEHLSPHDLTALQTGVDDFLRRYSTSLSDTRSLTKDNLLQVYEAVAVIDERATLTSASLDKRLASLIWNDLKSLVGVESNGDANNNRICLDDVYEICCVVTSDRDDVVLATLS